MAEAENLTFLISFDDQCHLAFSDASAIAKEKEVFIARACFLVFFLLSFLTGNVTQYESSKEH